jgi:hypothetical protein
MKKITLILIAIALCIYLSCTPNETNPILTNIIGKNIPNEMITKCIINNGEQKTPTQYIYKNIPEQNTLTQYKNIPEQNIQNMTNTNSKTILQKLFYDNTAIDNNNNSIPVLTSTSGAIYDKYWDVSNSSFALLASNPIANSEKYNATFNSLYVAKNGEQNSKKNTNNNNNNNNNTNNNIDNIDNIDPTLQKTINHDNLIYNIFGLATNPAYNQYFIIYENSLDEQNYYDDYKTFNYILVKNDNGKYIVMHKLQPRKKMFMGESISFTYGAIQINPLFVSKL